MFRLFFYIAYMDFEYLGVSEKFPFQPDANAAVELISDAANIKQSIEDILSTPIGESFYNEQRGSNIERLNFVQEDEVFKNLLYYHSWDALRNQEKRIEVLSIDISMSNGQTKLNITYQILASNEIDSFVYPFYREIKS